MERYIKSEPFGILIFTGGKVWKIIASFTEGKILQPLIMFAFPVLLALFLQAMYGAVDLLIVGRFASSADVSAVSTGSQIMTTLTNLLSSFAMGTTILLGQQIGSGSRNEDFYGYVRVNERKTQCTSV